VDCRQHGFAEEYMASENADLYASLLGITRTRQFGDLNSDLEVSGILWDGNWFARYERMDDENDELPSCWLSNRIPGTIFQRAK